MTRTDATPLTTLPLSVAADDSPRLGQGDSRSDGPSDRAALGSDDRVEDRDRIRPAEHEARPNDQPLLPTLARRGEHDANTSRVRAVMARLEAALLRPVEMAWLAAYRILFGLALAISMERFLAYGWVDELLVAPTFRFHYWGFGWIEPLSSGAMHALFWVLMGLALAMAAGFAFRVTAPLFAAGLTYIQLIDVSNYLNHYYLAALIAWLFAFSPANRAWSLDAWLRSRLRGHASTPRSSPHVATAWLVLFRVQIGVVYFFAGLAKAQSDWLLHGQPLGIWLGASTHLPLLGWLFTLDGVPLLMSWAGFLYDTTIVFWLSFRRTRPWAFVVVLVFHVLTRLLFDIGMFPIIMTLSALVFFSPAWPKNLAEKLGALFSPAPESGQSPTPNSESKARRDPKAHRGGRRASNTAWLFASKRGDGRHAISSEQEVRVQTPPDALASRSGWTRAALGLGALYCAAQILMPLRCHVYGGNVLWHEQGMRFSWRVMVRAKGGAVTFLVRQKSTGRVYHVNPREYLAPFQDNEMSSQPDLILQLAHHIQRDFEARGYGPVEVRAESKVSLNGRPGAPLVDPDVDLTLVHDGIARATWILPAPKEAPPPTRPVK